jgi:hypothetical protein
LFFRRPCGYCFFFPVSLAPAVPASLGIDIAHRQCGATAPLRYSIRKFLKLVGGRRTNYHPRKKKGKKEEIYKIKTKQEHDKPKELEEKMTSKKP